MGKTYKDKKDREKKVKLPPKKKKKIKFDEEI